MQNAFVGGRVLTPTIPPLSSHRSFCRRHLLAAVLVDLGSYSLGLII